MLCWTGDLVSLDIRFCWEFSGVGDFVELAICLAGLAICLGFKSFWDWRSSWIIDLIESCYVGELVG